MLITAADSVIVSGAGNSNPSQLSVSTESMASGAGAGGQLVVTANNIILTEGGQVSSTSFGAGQGGTVTLNATEAVTMTGTFAEFPSGIFARAAGIGEHAGNGGNIVVTGRNVTVSGGGRMDSATIGAWTGRDTPSDCDGESQNLGHICGWQVCKWIVRRNRKRCGRCGAWWKPKTHGAQCHGERRWPSKQQ